LRVYLDACCLNRLTDDQSQARIRDEAEAVESVFRMVRMGMATWISSTALEVEINRNPDADRRHDVAVLLALANEVIVPQTGTAERATVLQKLGLDPFDALHLACAEEGRADVFLTTDDALIRRAGRRINEIRTRVMNPVSWYQEVAL
jgi:predicted nucleic acid-binding protein